MTNADQIDQLPVETREVAARIGNDIEERVNLIREKKATIEQLRLSSGIVDCEAEIEILREKLYPLSKEYLDVTGTNWQQVDEEGHILGYCQWRAAAESHKFETKEVDAGLSLLAKAKAGFDEIAGLTSPRFNIKSLGRLMTAEEFAASRETSTDETVEVLLALSSQYRALQEEIALRLGALQNGIDTIQTSRSTSKIKGSVSIK